ncbi:hypothetical protein [Vampirovibrio chlorellavorus]|uniref:hypothetical protein n=1 Tax=Vampirovibrio chlorellavorus TaxID=758823 RepID=UPI0026EFE702|nr:hypothetical protein [Vampirovibrio chlorellavorus]
MPPRIKQGEVPKPILKKGIMGGFPFNALTTACLHAGYTDCVIDFGSPESSPSLRAASSVQIGKGRQKITVDLGGRFYNSYSDALYRGQLPEVILAAPSATRFPDYILSFTDYIEQLAKLGFFVPRKQVLQRDPVTELIPCTILTGEGLLFSRFITELMSSLKTLQREHPSLSDDIRMRIIGRFVRGFWDSSYSPGEPDLGPISAKLDTLPQVPTHISIAGGDLWTQGTIQTVLQSRGLQVKIPLQNDNAPERLEFQKALTRVSTVILPALIRLDMLSESEAASLAPKIQEGIWTIGIKRDVLSESEKTAQPDKHSKAKSPQASKPALPQLGWSDVAIMAGLNHYAQTLHLPEESQLFGQLTQKLFSYCQQQ